MAVDQSYQSAGYKEAGLSALEPGRVKQTGASIILMWGAWGETELEDLARPAAQHISPSPGKDSWEGLGTLYETQLLHTDPVWALSVPVPALREHLILTEPFTLGQASALPFPVPISPV